MSITPEQLAQLQTLVGNLVSHTAEAAGAKADSDAAHVALAHANADAQAKDAAEATANAVVDSDVGELQHFVAGLGQP